MKKNNRVDFIGVGPPKTATTWLAKVLNQHPDIFIPDKKELHYFNEQLSFNVTGHNIYSTKGLDWYHEHFSGAEGTSLWGEISTHYFHSEECPGKIAKYNPHAKIIVTLRHPIEKAISLYKHGIKTGVIHPKKSFYDATNSHKFILQNSYYSDNLERYQRHFSDNQLLILLYDDIRNHPIETYNTVTDFLNLKRFTPP